MNNTNSNTPNHRRQINSLTITHKPGLNYGGIAQAYALQSVIQSYGVTNTITSSNGTLLTQLSSNRALRRIARKKPLKNYTRLTRHTQKFIDCRMNVIDFKSAKAASRKGKYDIYISGSDQVWRARYVYVPHYLFSFVKSDKSVKISYAASFGSDNLGEYSKSILRKTRKLAQKFDSISVREYDGVKLVNNHWHKDAEHNVDPTLLLDADHYSELIENPSTPLPKQSKGGLFVYILDNSKESLGTIGKLADETSLEPHRLIAKDGNNGEPLPPVEQWLRSFRDADFVVTDSFHGTVFSIIFNKPFISIGNKDRGLARFTSLLKMFDLTDRLVTSSEDITTELLSSEIDWKKVNSRVKEEQNRSMEYLRKHLSSDEQK